MTMQPWKALVAAYQRPISSRACWQVVNSVGSYVALWGLMAWTAQISLWLAFGIAVVAGAMLVRVFIIFHDCGHGSFFANRSANAFWGFVTGVLTFTPYDQWRCEHAIHHGANGNLDRRGIGDIWTMTVREYEEAGRWKRFAYRVARNPIVLLVVAPTVMFVLQHRVPKAGTTARERRSVWLTTLGILLVGTALSFVFGVLTYVLLQLAVIAVAGAIGVWLFYAQHQFEEAYWQRGEAWNYEEAAMRGSSFLKLPRVLQWFTGNIGYHHIHHLNSRIPNYNLQDCHESHPFFHGVTPLTLWRSLRAFGLKLWDESSGRMVCFRYLTQKARGLA